MMYFSFVSFCGLVTNSILSVEDGSEDAVLAHTEELPTN